MCRPLYVAALVVAAACTPQTLAAEIDAAGLFTQLDADGDGRLTAAEAGADHARLFARLLRIGDEDADGALSADEFAVALQPVRAEKGEVEKEGSRLPGADALTVLVGKMDRNADGRLIAREIPPRFARAFQQMLSVADGDHDGQLDPREIARAAPRLSVQAQRAVSRMGLAVEQELAALPPTNREAIDAMEAYPKPGQMLADPRRAAELFRRLDADGNAHLAAEEALATLGDRFGRLLRRGDRDGDGQLSDGEFVQAARRLARAQQPAAGNDEPGGVPAAKKRAGRREIPAQSTAD